MNALRCTKRPAQQLRRAGAVLQRRTVQNGSYSRDEDEEEKQPRWLTDVRPKRTDHPPLRRDLDLTHLTEFPSLLHPNPYLDTTLSYDEPPNWANPHSLQLKIHNAVRTFWPIDEETGQFKSARETAKQMAEMDAMDEEDNTGGYKTVLASLPRSASLPRGPNSVVDYHRYLIWTRRAVQQTGKGKIVSSAVLMIVGNGDGLVGWGDGKHEQGFPATNAAFREAIVNLDRVERFENRTIWHETRLKFGATEVVLRPRPLGFGLRTGPIMHQVCKAAGIKDISGEIRGSRNPQNVIKATCLALWSGGARPGMGDGVGGGGRRTEKGQGVRSREEIERARGRNLLLL